MEPEILALTLPIRRLVEFLLRTGSIDSRFTGFDRALEGARLHRKLQRAAVKESPDYQAEAALKQDYTCAGIAYTLEGRADGIFTDKDGTPTIDEIKTTTLPPEFITGEQSPEHWAQAQIYAAIYARQQGLPAMRVRLVYYQVDEDLEFTFNHDYSADALDAIVTDLLTQYAPWAKRSAEWQRMSRASRQALPFPFASYRPGQRAMMNAVYKTCTEGGQLLCQAPTGIGKTMSVLFPALKAVGEGGPIFYLTARGTTRAAAENALTLLRAAEPDLKLRSVTLTAKDKICLQEHRECTPEACPYANGYYDRVKAALWDGLDTHALTADALQALARKHKVCPFELGLDLSLWCDVVVGDYNYLFDPVVHLMRFFETAGDYLFLIDEAHNLPGRARDMHSASLCKSAFYDAKKRLGKGKSSLKNALTKVNNIFIEWRHRCEEVLGDSRFGRTYFEKSRAEDFDRALTKLCEPLEIWLDEHRDPGETHDALLQLYFDIRAWLRVADTFDNHFILQISAVGSEVRAAMLCLDPSDFLAADFAKGRAAVLFSATLAPAGYYKDLCGLPDARAVALRSPFDPTNMGLWCARQVSTRYKDRADSIAKVSDLLAVMAAAQPGHYLAFFPSYSYLQQVWEDFTARYPDQPTLCQESAMDEGQRTEFLAQFLARDGKPLLGFAVLGGVFGEGVDLTGESLIGVAVVSPGLPQIGPRQEQLRDYFEETRGAGFDYAYRYPGMNKVLQAAGRVIRTPQDRGVVLLIDDRFLAPDTRRLMPPHWEHLRVVDSADAWKDELAAFWKKHEP
ncbi:ATP-dependent DNA helicase [Gemmiger sp.]|uniref:ATP-dependent DNA helicase n=1 Tax=Gemmiger sp. TaxID=2049027 RepID=UPI0026707302|nr:ATP-dependent DNA helicase [uncultured Gemmiger sp.]